MINKITLLGNVGKDPEVKHLESGSAVATMSLATSEKYKNKQGEMVQEVQWHNLVFWGKSAEIAEKYITKGTRLYVEGKVVYRSHGEDAEKRYYTDIRVNNFQMLGGGQREQSNETAQTADAGNDDLPF